MSNIMVLGGMSKGHCFDPMPFMNGSINVLINGIPVGRMGDDYNSGPHSCGDEKHDIGKAAGGYPKVLVNGLPIHLLDQPITCGDKSGKTPAQRVFAGI